MTALELPPIPPLDEAAEAWARARLDRLTKPPGSLGRLEDLARRLVAIRGRDAGPLRSRRIVVMAGDHGVVTEGVSAYPPEVTPQMVGNFLAGGAAINALARAASAEVVVVDVGVAADLDGAPGLVRRKVRAGTANIARGPAMTRDEAAAAVRVGVEIAVSLAENGCDVVGLGEMGIGNTTPSAAIVAAVCRIDPAEAVGRGTGLDDAGLARKAAVVRRALEANRPDPRNGLDVVAKVGGLEIAGLAGVAIGAASRRVPVVLDGFIAGAAALVASLLAPASVGYMVAAHRSAERGHAAALARLGLEPLLDLNLRLGEGTGAALALPILDASLRFLHEMATFESAGVSDRSA